MQIDFLTTSLTATEADELVRQESIIEKGLQTFVEVGNALLIIRDTRLYRQTHATFEDYCRQRWGWERRHAYRLIDAAQVVENVSHGTQTAPINERQTRPLASIPPEDQPEVWQRATDIAPNGKVTSRHVQQAVDEYEEQAQEYAESPDGYDWDDDPDIASGDSMAVHYSSNRHDWETPQELFDLINQEFNFTLDVCATPETAKCARYFTPEVDGLAQDWLGETCWMNPPYGDAIPAWMKKAFSSAQVGATVVCLVPARIDTGWWWDSCIAGEIRFLKGRVRFRQGDDKPMSAPFPSAVVVLGKDVVPSTVWWDWRNDL